MSQTFCCSSNKTLSAPPKLYPNTKSLKQEIISDFLFFLIKWNEIHSQRRFSNSSSKSSSKTWSHNFLYKFHVCIYTFWHMPQTKITGDKVFKNYKTVGSYGHKHTIFTQVNIIISWIHDTLYTNMITFIIYSGNSNRWHTYDIPCTCMFQIIHRWQFSPFYISLWPNRFNAKRYI